MGQQKEMKKMPILTNCNKNKSRNGCEVSSLLNAKNIL